MVLWEGGGQMPFLVFNVLPFFKSRMKTDFVLINILLIAWLNIAVAVLSPNGRISHSNRTKVVAKASFLYLLSGEMYANIHLSSLRLKRILLQPVYLIKINSGEGFSIGFCYSIEFLKVNTKSTHNT